MLFGREGPYRLLFFCRQQAFPLGYDVSAEHSGCCPFLRHQNDTSMPVIKEVSPVCPLNNLKTDIRKGAISLFMCELLLKTVRESSPDPSVFSFLANSVMFLDAVDEGCENFHLHFAVNLCKVLGYMPEDNYSEASPHFNFANGKFSGDYTESFCFLPEESALLHQILSTPLTHIPPHGTQVPARPPRTLRLLIGCWARHCFSFCFFTIPRLSSVKFTGWF